MSVMSEEDPAAKVQEAWQAAALELGIEFIGPYTIGEGNDAVQYHGFVPGFGSPMGTVFFASFTFREDFHAASRFAASQGYYFSVINAALYGTFKRACFVEALKDWGWHSKDREPPHGFSRHIPTEKRKDPKQLH